MKHILSFIFISALVFSASATAAETVAANLNFASDVMSGFTSKLGYADLSPAFDNCSSSINSTIKSYISAASLIQTINNTDSLELEEAVSQLGYFFAHSVKTCGRVITDFNGLAHVIVEEMRKLNRSEISNRFYNNIFTFGSKGVEMKTFYSQGQFKKIGENAAEMFNMAVFGNMNGPKRVIRELESITEKAKNFIDSNATYLFILGLLEGANTTISVNDFTAFAKEAVVAKNLVLALQAAIQKMDISTLISMVPQIQNTYAEISKDVLALKNETTEFVQRDLPLFNSTEKITHAVKKMIMNLPTTIGAIQNITNAYNSGDVEALGKSIGAFYNIFRDAASSTA